MSKISIKSLNLNDLIDLIKENNESDFRLTQLLEWLYYKNVNNFELMTNLPRDFIEYLSSNFVIENARAENIQKSNDGTVKFLLKFNTISREDAVPILVETVAIPANNKNSDRWTLCISSQAGCLMRCKFCATGQQGFVRNLYTGEILEQVIFVSNYLNIQPNNIVVMGQGEPFLNFDNVLDALNLLNNQKGFNIGARKITVSTCGIISGIKKYANTNKQYGLAVSLHSAIQEKRDEIMPGVKNFTLSKLKNEIKNYINITNRRVSFEYLMIKDFNDTNEDLDALKTYCKNMLCHINLIKLNDIPNCMFKPSKEYIINSWVKQLNSFGIETTVRDSRGSDIDAACGQLLHKSSN